MHLKSISMSDNTNFHILIAEDNDVSREMMTSILHTKGYTITGARDGEEAIGLIEKGRFDLALVDINMAPKGGFELARYILSENIDLPVVIITSDESSDLLIQASDLGVVKVLQKPVLPDRLIHTVEHIFARRHGASKSIATETVDILHDHKGLMLRAIELAVDNATSGNGRAFGAVVADQDGRIIGEGVNGFAARYDPVAHAEVMAIRQACEKLESGDLSKCALYCSYEPTMIGKALILGVGLPHVYYSLSHSDIEGLKDKEDRIKADLSRDVSEDVAYEQLCFEEACKAFSITPKD